MKLRLVCLNIMLSLLLTGTLTSKAANEAAADALLGGQTFDKPQFLPVDEAFVLTINRQGSQIQLHWLVQPGYYLYKDRLSFSGMEYEVGSDLPSGKKKLDEIFGEVEVYYDELAISLAISGDFQADGDKIVVGYQGCADAGLCYPPQKREFLVKNL